MLLNAWKTHKNVGGGIHKYICSGKIYQSIPHLLQQRRQDRELEMRGGYRLKEFEIKVQCPAQRMILLPKPKAEAQ